MLHLLPDQRVGLQRGISEAGYGTWEVEWLQHSSLPPPRAGALCLYPPINIHTLNRIISNLPVPTIFYLK